ncbi:D-alanyl-D-alanine carboxypeptidase DacC [Georgfuchsia toluolica]|uniref:serine-type D-Ala-D-Ala carboxypeptidase n=1 Tax=Georgfuchsia toluolica TaxID=424218 RepID=A0A916J5V9_9PROT|nr:D-alanyl-D-alanine carboxypeptidase family protein [Georgfuchsia toluolica]CAG4884819.1 D-alanyl-D-alanine carboxypeptidase DacC [Georgfuchsia toluolica]
MRFLILLLCLFAGLPAVQAQTPSPVLAARAWALLDYGSGQVLAANNSDMPLEPASLTKVMTAYLTYAALKQNTLRLDQTVTVSERAWRTPGSRSFIEVSHKVKVDDLLKGMIIQSGNDAAVALAEAIAGSEDGFAATMNRQATLLGMSKTHFLNASGYFDGPQPGHVSTAGDMARLAAALMRDFPEAHTLHAAKEYSFNGIHQYNRNRLLWLDPTVDGLKTGHSEAAGYCLIGTAKRGERRLISVVLGTASDDARTQESLKLLNYGFQAFDGVKLYNKGQAVSQVRIFKGAQSTLAAGFNDDFVVSLPKGTAKESIKAQLETRQPLLAPVQKGAQVGTLKLFVDNKPWGQFPVYALEDVPMAGMLGRGWDTLKLWLQ